MQQPSPYEHAGLLIRAFAVFLDQLILLPVLVIFTGLLADTTGTQSLISLIVSGIYYVMFLQSSWQATPGKRIVGIYVVSQDGNFITKEQALMRYLAFIMPALPLHTSLETDTSMVLIMWLHLIWFFPVALTINKTGIHDMLCHTFVVHGRAEGA
ncbi:MAG: RDD family protein [Rickettsiales bacterium]|nr:RDD family protein [Rickettsiales bacterium]